jgi:ankyrin repeat protein
VKKPDKARETLKSNPGLLRARWRLDETPLHFLAIEGYLCGVRLLGQLGMDVNAVNEFGDTALTEVVTLGNVEMMEELSARPPRPSSPSEPAIPSIGPRRKCPTMCQTYRL